MAGIDEVLERLVADSAFRRALAQDPQAALSGYDLTGEDVDLLTAQLDEGGGGEHGVEQRTSKSAIVGFLAAFSGGVGETAETAAKGTFLPEDSGDPDALTSTAVPAAEDTAQQSGDPDQPIIRGSVYNYETGSGKPAADLTTEAPDPEEIGVRIERLRPASLIATQGGGVPQSGVGEGDIDSIAGPDDKSADNGWYTAPPSITVSGESQATFDYPGEHAPRFDGIDETSVDGTEVGEGGTEAPADIDTLTFSSVKPRSAAPSDVFVGEGGTEDPVAAGHQVEYQVGEGEK